MTAKQQPTPKKGRPTPKRDGTVSTKPDHQRSASSTTATGRGNAKPPATSKTTAVLTRILQVSCAVIVAAVHIMGSLYLTAYSGAEYSTTLFAVALAAGVTVLFIPHARRHGWHRWFIVWGLSVIVYPDYIIPVMIAAEAWVLHRFWVVEGPPRTPGFIAVMFDKETPDDPKVR